MQYSEKTDRRRLGSADGTTEGDGKFELVQLAALAAACRIPLYNLVAPLQPEEVRR